MSESRTTTAAFPHGEPCTPAGAVERFRAASHLAVFPPDQQGAVLDEVAAVLAAHPDTRDRREIVVPYRAGCYWCVWA